MATKKSDARKYLDKLVRDGVKEIKIAWNGGNDDGCYSLLVDGKEIDFYDSKESGVSELMEIIPNRVGYGSFAGDFSADGEVVYDSHTGRFLGYDNYEESREYTFKFTKPLKVIIPKTLWFDNVAIELNGYPGDVETAVQLTIMNGPVLDEHAEFETNAENYLRGELDYVLDNEIEDANSIYYLGEFKAEGIPVNENGDKVVLVEQMIYHKYEGDSKDLAIHIQ